MELRGIEPRTSCMPCTYLPSSVAYSAFKVIYCTFLYHLIHPFTRRQVTYTLRWKKPDLPIGVSLWYYRGMDLTARLARKPTPKKLICRLRLCSATKEIYHGHATYLNEQKRNHEMQQVYGIYHFDECPDCGRIQYQTLAWQVINEDKFNGPSQPTTLPNLHGQPHPGSGVGLQVE